MSDKPKQKQAQHPWLREAPRMAHMRVLPTGPCMARATHRGVVRLPPLHQSAMDRRKTGHRGWS